MKVILKIGVLILLLLHHAEAQPLANKLTKRPDHTFGWEGEHFLLDGKPFVIRSGEMHYPRIPRAYWRDRMKKAKAMGLNTICTYIFWNVHESSPGKFDFTGNLNVAEFIRIAHEEGLWVIVRPGPYICTEWDFGGLPAWLLATPDVKVRHNDERFIKASASYMKRVGQELGRLQITHGGPIIMIQVENEYGSFGKDKTYMNAVKRMILDAGFDVPLFTADGSLDYMLAGGTLPDVLSVVNFGGDNPAHEFANFAKFRESVPRMSGEYWIGWFDHWGEKHHTVETSKVTKGVDWMLANGISFNLYMFHGGTSFGFMSGANYSRNEPYQPDITSYDYDSPLDEAGRPTAKFFALREVIKKHLPQGETLPDLPPQKQLIEISRFELKESASLFSALNLLSKPVRASSPMSMEALGQSYGFALYRKRLERDMSGTLDVREPRDYALVFQNGKQLGTLDRRKVQHELNVALNKGAMLNILVENMGRINFGPKLIDERKGLLGNVTLGGKELNDWEIYSLPLTDLRRLKFNRQGATGPAFYRGAFTLTQLGDTFLDTRGWGKGYVWINGHNLGRFWRIGPQQTLFVPADWLKQGRNEIIVLDLEEGRERTVQGLKNPVYETPYTGVAEKVESKFLYVNQELK